MQVWNQILNFSVGAVVGSSDAKHAPKRKAPAADDVKAAEADEKVGRKRGRSFVFTVNLPLELLLPEYHVFAESLHARLLADDRVRDSVFSLEKAGRYHFQGFMRLYRDSSFPVAHTILDHPATYETPWVQHARDPGRSWDYCLKPDSHIGGPWIKGKAPAQGKRTGTG